MSLSSLSLKILSTLLLLSFSVCTYAQTSAPTSSFMCPNTYRYIQPGLTTDEVQAACGEASGKQLVDQQSPVIQPTMSWFYSLNSSSGGNRVQVIFTMRDRKVVGINLGGQEVTSADICNQGGVAIKVGDNDARVRNFCGNPGLQNIGGQVTGTNRQRLQEWTYNFGPGRPLLVLRFDVNNRLVTIETR